MKSSSLFWGFLILSIGIVFLLDNLDVYHFVNFDIVDFWPLLLIIIGVNFFKIPNEIKVVNASIAGIFTALLITSAFSVSTNFVNKISDDIDVVTDIDTNTLDSENAFSIYKVDTLYKLKSAVLNIESGAGFIKFIPADSITFMLKTNYTEVHFDNDFDSNNTNANINVSIEKHINISSTNGKKVLKNASMVYLNNALAWDLNMAVGAAKLDADLTDINVKTLNLSSGAAESKIKIGNLSADCQINVESGVASTKIMIPKDIYCELNSTVIFSQTDFNGFTKRNDTYYTDDVVRKDKKISINIEGAMGKVEVVRY